MTIQFVSISVWLMTVLRVNWDLIRLPSLAERGNNLNRISHRQGFIQQEHAPRVKIDNSYSAIRIPYATAKIGGKQDRWGNEETPVRALHHAFTPVVISIPSLFPRSCPLKTEAKREPRRDIRGGSLRLNTNPRKPTDYGRWRGRDTVENQRNTRRRLVVQRLFIVFVRRPRITNSNLFEIRVNLTSANN